MFTGGVVPVDDQRERLEHWQRDGQPQEGVGGVNCEEPGAIATTG